MPTAMDQAAPEQMAAEQRTRTFSWVHVVIAVVVTIIFVFGATTLLLTMNQQGEEEDAAFLRAQNSKLMEQLAELERSTSGQRAALDACGRERDSLRRGYDGFVAAIAAELGATGIDDVLKRTVREQQRIVERFFDLVLPPAPIDYDAAALILAPELAEKLRADIAWVPKTLGIQDGPNRVAVLDLEGHFGFFDAHVGGYYDSGTDEPERVWNVSGEFQNGKWIITNITTQR